MTSQLTDDEAQANRRINAEEGRLRAFEGVFKTFALQHRDLVRLVRRLAATSDVELRTELFPRVRDELLAHEQGEIEVLFPLLRSHSATYELARRHDEAARKLEVILECLDGYALDHDEWKPTVEMLQELVEHHVDEEESTFFPLAQEALGEDIAHELDEQYEEYCIAALEDQVAGGAN